MDNLNNTVKNLAKRCKALVKGVWYIFKLTLSPFKQFITKRGFRIRTKYAYFYKNLDIVENTVLYESYQGKNMSCNPYAIFKQLISDPQYTHLKHVWAVNDPEDTSISRYKGIKNVEFVKVNSTAYLRYLAEAKYLINNTTFPYYFIKKKGQIYINTWHGTPLKTLGKHVKGAEITLHKNVQRNLLHCDYFISPNKYTYQKLFDSHDVDSIYNGKIIDEGYPRVDLTLKANKQEIRKILGVPADKKVILYAPTWRGIGTSDDTSIKIYEDYKKIQQNFSEKYVILLKAHYFTYEFFKQNGMKDVCVPNWVDTNELLSIVDVLITDYSSIFFDYIPTRKPVLFYVYDREVYEKERGFYFDLNDLPGPLCYNVDDLINSIKNIDEVIKDYKPKYEQNLKQFCYNDNGGATNRVIDTILKGKDSKQVFQVNSDKTKLLMYCGNFKTNGITTSAINLFNNLDHSKYNVTVITSEKVNDDTARNLRKLHPEVNLIFRTNTFNFTIDDYYKHRLVMRFGLNSKRVTKLIPKNLYRRELSRVIGDAKFDIAVDFSGYNDFWTLLFAFNDFKKKCIYLHNDMLADSNRKVNDKYPFRKHFKKIFHLYKHFDQLIGVSKSSMEANVKNLKEYVETEKIAYANNVLDGERIFTKLSNEEFTTIKGISFPQETNFNFVTVGRLSPEKDHAKLIEAFSQVEQEFENVRLYIIGEGPLESELQSLIERLGLEKKVFLVGLMDNPFILINECDCFVLSSNWEGQAIVLLEAMVLEKPIISTDIPGPRSVIEDGYGLLVENSKEGLREGMSRFCKNGLEVKEFNYEDYNKRALEMFYDHVCKIE